jgi:DNA primase RepB-like protein
MQPKATVHPAVEYLELLFDQKDLLCLAFIHSTKKFAAGNAVTENVFVPMSKVVSKAGIARLKKRNEDGWNVFCSMQPFKVGSTTRTKANVSEIKHCFIDCDERGDEVLADLRAAVASGEVPAPSVVVQSSPHKFQAVWQIYGGLTVAEVEALNSNIMLRFGTDAACTDAARILRVPGFRNLKYADKPLATIIESYNHFMLTVDDFHITQQVLPESKEYNPPSSAAVEESAELLEDGMEAAGVLYGRPRAWDGGLIFPLERCAWAESHTNGAPSDAVVIVQPSGAFTHKCLHSHCQDKLWKDYRKHLEKLAGRRLNFDSRPTNGKSKQQQK